MHKLSRSSENTQPQLVYLIRLTPKNQEPYYKIGRTAQDLSQRFLYKDIPSWHRISETSPMTAADAVMLEATLHGAFRNQRVIPILKFGGWTECFNLNEEDVAWIKHLMTEVH